MELSEQDEVTLTSSPIDALVIIGGGVVKVIDRDDERTWFVILQCAVFARCGDDATLVIDHSVLGQVPACQRCTGVTR